MSRRHPTKRCMFMQGPAEQPAASKHRKQIIIPGYHYTNTCSVDLKLLRKFKKLQVLALPLATRAVDPEDLAALTQLTSLTISMRRRNHLGLGKCLQCDSLPCCRALLCTRCNPRSQHGPVRTWECITVSQALPATTISAHNSIHHHIS